MSLSSVRKLHSRLCGLPGTQANTATITYTHQGFTLTQQLMGQSTAWSSFEHVNSAATKISTSACLSSNMSANWPNQPISARAMTMEEQQMKCKPAGCPHYTAPQMSLTEQTNLHRSSLGAVPSSAASVLVQLYWRERLVMPGRALAAIGPNQHNAGGGLSSAPVTDPAVVCRFLLLPRSAPAAAVRGGLRCPRSILGSL